MDKIGRIKIKIYGSVQGVFFRFEAQKEALSLGLSGYAKNLDDGTVEIVAEGEENILKKLLGWCNDGPDLAKVEKVESSFLKPTGEFSEFKIE